MVKPFEYSNGFDCKIYESVKHKKIVTVFFSVIQEIEA